MSRSIRASTRATSGGQNSIAPSTTRPATAIALATIAALAPVSARIATTLAAPSSQLVPK
jgi:hypothetical protein